MDPNINKINTPKGAPKHKKTPHSPELSIVAESINKKFAVPENASENSGGLSNDFSGEESGDKKKKTPKKHKNKIKIDPLVEEISLLSNEVKEKTNQINDALSSKEYSKANNSYTERQVIVSQLHKKKHD